MRTYELIGADKRQTFNQTNCTLIIGKIDMSKSYITYKNINGDVIITSAPLKWISLSRKVRRHNRKPKTHFKK